MRDLLAKVKSRMDQVFLDRPLTDRTESEEAESDTSGIVQHELPPELARSLLYILVAMFVVAFIWAAVSKVDVVVEAPGELVPRGKVKTIQPAAPGSVDKVLVEEGDNVKAGQTLVLLERTQYDAELKKQTEALAIAKSELSQFKEARIELEAILANPNKVPEAKVDVGNIGQLISDVYSTHAAMIEAGVDYQGAAGRRDLSSSDMAALKKRLAEMRSQKAAQEHALVNRQQEYADKLQSKKLEIQKLIKERHHAKVELGTMKEILAKSKEQKEAYETVFKQGAVARVTYLDSAKMYEQDKNNVQHQEAQIVLLGKQLEIAESAEKHFRSQFQADISQLKAEINKLGGEIAQVSMQVREKEREYKLASSEFEAADAKARAALEKVIADIGENERRVKQVQSDLRAARRAYEEADIRAPIAGKVASIKLHGKNEVVKHGQVLMKIVPKKAPLVVEAQVANEDIGFVEVGQDAKLKLTAFPHHEYGIIKGKVEKIDAQSSEDVVGESAYKVTVIPERDWIRAKGKKIKFVSGMEVISEIVVRKRTILDIFLEPIKNLQDTRWV